MTCDETAREAVKLGFTNVQKFVAGWGAWFNAGHLYQLTQKTRVDDFVPGIDTVPVDCRAAGDYATAHLPGAINVPLPAPANIQDLLDARATYTSDRLFILYDADDPGANLVNGAVELENAGYRGVVIYSEGIADWTANGGTTEP